MYQKIKRYWRQIVNNLKENGIKITLFKIYKYIKIRLTRLLTIDRKSLDQWVVLKNKYVGKRVFLIGNGPSLNRLPLYLLENEYTMCFNRFNVMFERLSWKPSFYMNIDPLVAEDMSEEINQIVPHVDIAFFPDIHTNGKDFRKFIKNKDNIQWMFPQYKDFYFDLPRVALGGSVAYPALQVLTYLGFSEIYLIGVDMNYQVHKTADSINNNETDISSTDDDDPNHFDPRYFGKGRKYHQPVKKVVDNIMNSFEYAAEKIATHTGVKVRNAGIDSKVNCFEKVEFGELFLITEEKKFEMFNNSFSGIIKFNSYEDMINRIPTVEVGVEEVEKQDMFLCGTELAIKIINKLVFDYLVYGPYKNTYLFISRNR